MGFGLLTLLTTFRMLFIPAQFQDAEFSCSVEELQQKIRVCQDYYNTEFLSVNGIDEFIFELSPIVTLSQPLSYYGSNYSNKKDAQIYQAAKDACYLINKDIDFSSYDSTKNGTVDVICILTPGQDETDTKIEEGIYPQYLSLKENGTSLFLDEKIIDKFVIACELSNYGVICHELAHHFGLPDFYDSDYDASGGRTSGLGGISLMDEGCKLYDYPVALNSIEKEILGIGSCDTLRVGNYKLEAINKSHHYLKVIGPNKNEYYLIECSPELDIRIFYIDKSENKRGYSDRQRKELTAAQRWESNEINTRPEMECAQLKDDNYCFYFFDGTSSSLTLTNIEKNNDGVRFSVIQPFVLSELNPFQDAVVIRWECDESITNIDEFRLSWKDINGEGDSVVIPSYRTYYMIEKLIPNSNYFFKLEMATTDGASFSIERKFSTKQLNKGTKPYIYLNQTERRENGAFIMGAKLLLRIFNGNKITRTDWYFNEEKIRLNKEGYFVVVQNGTLKAVIEYEDGGTETIIKEIRL